MDERLVEHSSNGHDPADAPRDRGLTWVDYLLGFLSLPLFAFLLMFAVTGMMEKLERPRTRRTIALCLIALEVLLLMLLVRWVKSMS